MNLQGAGRTRTAAEVTNRATGAFGAAVASGTFRALIRFLLASTDLPAYAAGNVAKLASVVVASTISFFLLRYVVFSCKR